MVIVKEKTIHTADGHIGLLKRKDGATRPILGITRCASGGRPSLHVQGTVIDFVASPTELRMRGYTIVDGNQEVLRLWHS